MRFPNRHDLTDTLVNDHGMDRIGLEYGSPSTVYGWALEKGVITREQFTAARGSLGSSWNYAGD